MKELSYFQIKKDGIIFRTWSVMRIARLVLALVAFGMSISQREPMFAMLGGILFLQAIFNMSCPGGACAAPPPRRTAYKSKFRDTASIEEVK